MGMSIEEACEQVYSSYAGRVESYELYGDTIKLNCRSSRGRSTYEGEVTIYDNGQHFTYSDPYGSNTPYFFGSNVCQLMTDGQITY